MARPARKAIPRATELAVLDRSRRRCALCFRLSGDLEEKQGQLAHVDGDPANGSEDNLAFLCLDHHSLFDSRTSQHKNYTPMEVKAARQRLYAAVAADLHVTRATGAVQAREADRVMFTELVQMMTQSRTADFLRRTCFGSESFHWRQLNDIGNYVTFSDGAEHEFIDRDMEALRRRLVAEYKAFDSLLADNTAPTRHNPPYRTVPMEWRDADPERYARTVKMLRAAADQVCVAYDDLVRAGRERFAS